MIILSRCSSWRQFSYILFWFIEYYGFALFVKSIAMSLRSLTRQKCGDKAEGYRRGHLEYTYTRANPGDCWLLRILLMQRLGTAEVFPNEHTQLATTCWTEQQRIIFHKQWFSCSCSCWTCSDDVPISAQKSVSEEIWQIFSLRTLGLGIANSEVYTNQNINGYYWN